MIMNCVSPQGPTRQCWPNKAAATEAGSSHSNGSNPLDPEELTEIIRFACPCTLLIRFTLARPKPESTANACRMVNQSDLVELELKSKRFTLALRKKEALEPPEPVYQVGGEHQHRLLCKPTFWLASFMCLMRILNVIESML